MFTCKGTPNVCTATPLDLGSSGTSVYLELYGTGLRNRSSLNNVTVTLGTAALTTTYAGPQGTYTGLDQINVILDRSLIGQGLLTLQLTADGQPANPVQLTIK